MKIALLLLLSAFLGACEEDKPEEQEAAGKDPAAKARAAQTKLRHDIASLIYPSRAMNQPNGVNPAVHLVTSARQWDALIKTFGNFNAAKNKKMRETIDFDKKNALVLLWGKKASGAFALGYRGSKVVDGKTQIIVEAQGPERGKKYPSIIVHPALTIVLPKEEVPTVHLTGFRMRGNSSLYKDFSAVATDDYIIVDRRKR